MNEDRPGKDRRRNRRFTCGGEVKISRLPSDGIVVPAKLRELSLGGCYLDTDLTIDYGTRAELVVRINAATFRALGEARAKRGPSGAGFEFVRLGGGGKDLLADLIEELARLQAAINNLGSVRRDVDARTFRKQLEEGTAQSEALSRRFAALAARLPALRPGETPQSEKACEPEQTELADKRHVIEVQPVVIAIDVFG